MTPVEELRRAAALMREQHGPDHVRHQFWFALADWLDDEAAGAQTPWGEPTAHALAVTRAYLAAAETAETEDGKVT
jgi:hypothetical protein